VSFVGHFLDEGRTRGLGTPVGPLWPAAGPNGEVTVSRLTEEDRRRLEAGERAAIVFEDRSGWTAALAESERRTAQMPRHRMITQLQIDEMRNRRGEGQGPTQIANEMNIPLTTVKRYLYLAHAPEGGHNETPPAEPHVETLQGAEAPTDMPIPTMRALVDEYLRNDLHPYMKSAREALRQYGEELAAQIRAEAAIPAAKDADRARALRFRLYAERRRPNAHPEDMPVLDELAEWAEQVLLG